MSSVAFHSPDHDTVRVGGAERIWAGLLCTRLMHGVWGLADFPALDRPPLDRLLRMIPDDHYVHDFARRGDAEGAARALGSALGGYDDCLTWNGQPVDGFSLALNTALVVGGDALRLSARVHGSCEIHGWVDGPNRAWLADIVDEGLASGVLRRAHQTQYENWPGVAALLRSTARTPVVMSYSVTESFPNAHRARPPTKPYNEMTEDQRDARDAEVEAWDALDAGTQWEQALAVLQAADEGLEIRPEDWTTFRFTHRLSGFDLLAEDWESRLDSAFPA
jgi:hypothetical protein